MQRRRMQPPRVLLLSAYAATSHRAWAEQLQHAHPDLDWQRLELPGRHFRWRIRGNPLSWLDSLPAAPPDLLLATSMVDLATLRGLHPRLANVPNLYYFHENQFAYPVSVQQTPSVEPQIVQLYGALAADRLGFNSAFNRDSFLAGVQDLMDRMPDEVPPGLRDRLAAKAIIRPVPIAPITPAAHRDPALVVWNHRWEYDKEPGLFADALIELAQQGVPFRVALLGPRAAQPPAALDRLRGVLGDRIVADACVDEERYRAIVGQAAIVVSTARHEFQGLALLEAASAGVRPLVPDALCYPEQYPPEYRYPLGDREALVTRLCTWLTDRLPPPVDVSAWYADACHPGWRDFLDVE